MPSASQAIFAVWSPPIPLTCALLLTAAIYTRGFYAIRKTRPALFTTWRPFAFHMGLAVIWIAIASPLDGFADALLSAHMVEHLLLMSIVAPLLLLGYPQVPLIRGLPRPVRISLLGPLLRLTPLRRLAHLLTTPLIAWLAMNLTLLAWHIPAAYDFALEHAHWHQFEHACFLATSLLFWFPLLLPWPSRNHFHGWIMILYLVSADIINTILAAFLAFCDRPVYLYYVRQPNPFHIAPLADQVAGAAFMWVVGSFIFLLPALYLTVRLMESNKKHRP
ncbi:MAG: cytochrome c oxidase assembly protein [Acidobacteriota bacterium]|nr:cytochrome c oxidase assembly protein [Acidobacteriota bacterium]